MVRLLECRTYLAPNSKSLSFVVPCGRSGHYVAGEYRLIVKSVQRLIIIVHYQLKVAVIVLMVGDSRWEFVVESWSRE